MSGTAMSRAMDSKVSFEPTMRQFCLTFWTGFMQKRFTNGTFAYTDPVACSPIDTVSRSCSLQDDNVVGFYESSSWEYSWYDVLFSGYHLEFTTLVFLGLFHMILPISSS